MIKSALILFLASVMPLCAKTITASSGTSSAVQAAIDSAASGDTVMIPNGTLSWSSGVQVKKFIKLLGSGSTVIVNTGGNTMVGLTPSSAGSVELGNIKFMRANGGQGQHVHVYDAVGKPVLVHNIDFENTGFGCRAMEWGTNGGVIYGCTFLSTDKSDNSGVAFKNPGSDSAWHEVDCMGTADTNGDKNTYMEDCTFKWIILQAIDFDDNSRIVLRHNTFDNSAITSHGQETSAVGARQWEIYDNDFTFTTSSNSNPGKQEFPLNLNYFLFIRGGGPGVCFDNKIPDISSSAWGNKGEVKFNLYNIRRRGQVPCQTKYPAARQIGFGSNAQGDLVSSPVYIWGNTGSGNYNTPGLEDYNPDECGNGLHTSEFVQKNRDFFVGTPKPGYEPFAYPHPLRGSAPQPTPSPSSTPQPSPSSTPTPPQPTPTPPQPSPTPADATYRTWLDEMAGWIKTHPPTPDQ